MPIKIPSLPSIPGGTISGQTSIPVSKTTTDPKTYKMTLDQTLAWIQANGGGGGGGTGAQGAAGAQGTGGTPGVQGASGYSGVAGTQGSPGLIGTSGYQGYVGPQGFTGVSGYQGFQGSMGSNTGQPGPGLVYTGAYRNTSYIYYNTLNRKDVVSYDSGSGLVYWLANSTSLTATSGASGYGIPGVDSQWANFGENFKSVATGLLLTEDASVTKTITLGEVSNLSAGIIRSANCDNFADGYGFWLGNDAQGRVGFFVGNSAGPSYFAYDSSIGAVALSGTIYATAGKIGGIGIADYTYSGGSSGTVLYSGNPLTPGTNATPIFINGRASGSYGNGEVIFGLGDGLVYYYLSAGGGTKVARLSGEIIANAGSIGGVGLNQGYIWSGGSGGVGYFANDNTPFWVNGNPNLTTDNYFSLGSNLVYYKTGGTPVLAVSGTITAEAGSIGGIGLNQGYIWTGGVGGVGYYNNANTPFYVNSQNGRFSLGNALSFDGTSLTISGNVQTSATSALSAALDDVNAKIWTDKTGKLVAPAASAVKSSTGLFLGPQYMGYWNQTSSTWKTYMDNTGGFYLNGTGDQSLLWNGSTLAIHGSLSAVDGKFYAGNAGRTKYVEWDPSGSGTFTVKGIEAADGITVTSGLGLRYYSNAGSFTITGGTGNGSQYGAQIDLVGNDYPSSGQGGQLVLQAGEGVGSVIAFHTNYAANVGSAHLGVQRMLINNDGLVNVKRASTILGYNSNAGNLRVDGNIGVDTNPADANVGVGNIDATGDVTAASFNTTSSRRYKKNITPLTDSLKTINKLQGVRFDWNNKSLTNDIGLIAEEVENVLPTLVHKNPSKPSEVIGLDYGRITAILVESVKELNKKIEELEKR